MNDYRSIRKIGEGGQAIVLLVEEVESGKQYALKKVFCDTLEELNLALKEVQACIGFNHPYIIRTKHFFVEKINKAHPTTPSVTSPMKSPSSNSSGSFQSSTSSIFDDKGYRLCIVSNFANKSSLKSYIDRNRKKKRIIGLDLILDFVEQLLIGIDYIHSHSVIHRDLKPENIYLNVEGERKEEEECEGENEVKTRIFLKIGDFGFAKNLSSGVFTKTVLGTPLYLSPEIKLQQDYDHRIDYWGIGCILLDLLLEKTVDYAYEMGVKPERVFSEIRNRYNKKIFNVSPKNEENEPTTEGDLLVNLVQKLVILDPFDRCTPQDALLYINNCRLYLEKNKNDSTTTSSKRENYYWKNRKNEDLIDEIFGLKEKIKNLQQEVTKLTKKTSSTNQQPPLSISKIYYQWSPIYRHRDIQVSPDGFSCSKVSTSGRGNQNILLTQEWKKPKPFIFDSDEPRIHKIMIKYINPENTFHNSMIGLYDPDESTNVDITKTRKSIGGGISKSVGLYFRDGRVYSDRASKEYVSKRKIQSNDVIELELRWGKKDSSLSFTINGVKFGKAFSDLRGDTYVVACTIYSNSEVFVIMN